VADAKKQAPDRLQDTYMRRKLLLTIPFVIASSLAGSSVISSDSQYVASASVSDLPKLAQSIRSSKNADPERLYDRVFNLIKDDFYEPEVLGKQNWDRWQHRYDGKLKTLEDSHKAIETMLASLGDRYTRFLDLEAFADEKSQIDA